MTLSERIKKVRKVLDLTQAEFGKKIGSTQNAIGNYETGHRNPSSSVINNICKTFNVSEEWLRTGTGEIFVPEPTFNLEEYIRRRGATDLEVEIIKAYFDLPPDMRRELLRHFQERPAMSTSTPAFAAKQTAAPDAGKHERTQPDITSELAELKRQNQELAAKVAAMEEEDAALGLTDVFSTLPSVSAGNFSPGVKK